MLRTRPFLEVREHSCITVFCSCKRMSAAQSSKFPSGQRLLQRDVCIKPQTLRCTDFVNDSTGLTFQCQKFNIWLLLAFFFLAKQIFYSDL
jgi:hypothetical protein